MNRSLLLFPAAAATVWAQQTSPAEDQAKQALIGRVQQYYQLMTEKKYRQAEAFVAEESRDDYYNGKKPDIKGFDITKVDLLDGGTRAKVTIKAKVLVLMMGAGAQVFEMPTPTNWKLENGQWFWYIPEEAKTMTPFGKIQTNAAAGQARLPDTKGKAPDLGTLQGQISIDRTSLVLNAEQPEQSVTIENGLPGPIDLRIDPHVQAIKGLTVKGDKLHLESGQKATIHVRWNGSDAVSDTVEIVAFPVNRTFDIRVSSH